MSGSFRLADSAAQAVALHPPLPDKRPEQVAIGNVIRARRVSMYNSYSGDTELAQDENG